MIEPIIVDPSKEPWLESARSLLGLKLRGLLVDCPNCMSKGVPMRKYKKGDNGRKISVIHKNGSGSLRLCHLTEDESDHVRSAVCITDRDLEKIVTFYSPYVLFSGGKDSICTLLHVKEIAERVGKTVTAVHVDTTAGLPESTKHVKDLCGKFDVKLRIVRPKKDFYSLAEKWGIPSHKFRWCCRELKIKPLAEYLKTVPKPKIVMDGIRAAESNIRSKYLPIWYHPAFKSLSVSPIFHWTHEEVENYLRESAIPRETIDNLKTSPDCWCGAYKSRNDFERLYRQSPRLFNRLAKLEQTSKTGFTFIYNNGTKLPLNSLREEIEHQTADDMRFPSSGNCPRCA